ncbi:MAG: YCF48-related protein [Melioribacteraceae bacterium]|nr:MAG: YCF48-related protein [Melioribacteraceae bacterium]
MKKHQSTILKWMLLSLFLLINQISIAQTDWQILSFSPMNLKSPYFINSEIGWAIDEFSNECYKTSDGGKSWIVSDVGGGADDLFFINENIGWACGSAKFLSRSTDGGNSWVVQSENDWSKSYQKILFVNELTGFLVSTRTRLEKTTDGGENWNEINMENIVEAFPEDIFFVNESIGWISGSKGFEAVLIKTTDGGITWKDTTFNEYESINYVKFENEHNGKILTADGSIGSTQDGGESWSFQNNPSASYGDSYTHLIDIDNNLFISVGYWQSAFFKNYPFVAITHGDSIEWIKYQINTNNVYELGYYDQNRGVLLGGSDVIDLRYDLQNDTVLLDSFFDITNETFSDIHFFDNENGLAISWEGVYKTENGGYQWTKIDSLGSHNQKLYFTSENDGWIVGNFIYKTNNNGYSWEQVDFGIAKVWNDIKFIDDQNGWLIGYNLIYQTTDGGQTWNDVTKMDGTFTAVDFIDNSTGYLCELDSIIWKTTDSGLTWHKISVPSIKRMREINFIDKNNGWLRVDQQFYKTNDGGVTWLPSVEVPSYIIKDSFVIGSNIWLIGSNSNGGILAYSDDYGENWEEINLCSREVSSIFMLSEETGWITGNGGLVLGTSNIVSVADERFDQLVNEYKLFQNYPNPFNPSTQIKFAIPQAGIVTVKVYDIIGREVTTLVNDNLNSGIHEVVFNANNLSSGIYFVRMTSQNFTSTKKIMVIK